MPFSIMKFLTPARYGRYIKRHWEKIRGDVFSNPGPIFDKDFSVIAEGIEEVKPRVFIEIGTGSGISARRIFGYLNEKYPRCHFYTIDIFKDRTRKIAREFSGFDRFHAVTGLSVEIEETTDPARSELVAYKGPVNVLRKLLDTTLEGQRVDIIFIDSRKGTALPEFLVIEPKMDPRGIIFCHDILNGGKGVEVLEYLMANDDKYEYEVIDTGPEGMIRIRLRSR